MITVIITRHCESTWHVSGRLAGQMDEAVLTAKGKKHAFEFAKKLRKYHIDTIYSSGLKRSIQTAEVIGKYLDKSVTKISGYNERSWGKLEGRLNSELSMELNSLTFIPLNGESFPVFVKRITNTLVKTLEKQNNSTILIVTHGGVKEVLEMLFKSLKPIKLHDIAIIVKGLDINYIKKIQKSYN